jgi:hypothetical protein
MEFKLNNSNTAYIHSFMSVLIKEHHRPSHLLPGGEGGYTYTISNRYHMVGSALWIIKHATPRAQPEGEGLYNP